MDDLEKKYNSAPYLTKFNPKVIPMQWQVIRDIRQNFDYSLGVHEIMLSGSLGCLREDALVQTAFGKVPISHISSEDYLLTYHASSNQFGLARGSGAFPKGKGNLYRVIGEHEEFVANAHHQIATYPYVYLPVSYLYERQSSFQAVNVQLERDLFSDQKLFVSSALNCWETVLNLIKHCVERIHQCGLQLPLCLSNVLNSFPLSNDAQEFGLFFFREVSEHLDDFQVRELRLDHTFECTFHQSMLDFFRHVEESWEDEANACTQVDLKSYERIFFDNLIQLLYRTQNAHPQVLLFFLEKFLLLLLNAFRPPKVCTSEASYRIEKLTSQDWYWDMKVPNTNNYISHGMIHHNSSKSALLAHVVVTHAIFNPGARILVGRRALPDAKRTILREIYKHITVDLKEGVDFFRNQTSGDIRFSNGSEVIATSWADGNYTKVRSLDLSMAVIEEFIETKSMDAYNEIKMRVGRIPRIKENIIICATNPGSPSSPHYKYFILGEKEHKTRHVYYSLTKDNPFLPEMYTDQLEKDLDPKLALRMLHGQWIELNEEVIYYAYDRERNFVDKDYEIDPMYPIGISWDFNIGFGKPMSAVIFQYINDTFHFFDEVIIEGARTLDTCEELADRGYFKRDTQFYLFGDATGRSRDTRNIRSDWDIIKHFFSNYVNPNGRLFFEMMVPLSNPPIRERHNIVNAYCQNAKKECRLYIYKRCKTLDEGMRLTCLKAGSNYLEDDTPAYQHSTTALGYAVHFIYSKYVKKDQARIGQHIIR